VKTKKSRYVTGRWFKEEHIKFLRGCLLYGNDWRKVSETIPSRNQSQIRSHSQKFIQRMVNFLSKREMSLFENLKIISKLGDNIIKELKEEIENKKKAFLEIPNYSNEDVKEIEKLILIVFKLNFSSTYKCLNEIDKNLNEKVEVPKKIKFLLRKKKIRIYPLLSAMLLLI